MRGLNLRIRWIWNVELVDVTGYGTEFSSSHHWHDVKEADEPLDNKGENEEPIESHDVEEPTVKQEAHVEDDLAFDFEAEGAVDQEDKLGDEDDGMNVDTWRQVAVQPTIYKPSTICTNFLQIVSTMNGQLVAMEEMVRTML